MSVPKKSPKGSPCRNWYVTNVHGRSSAALGSNAKSPYVCSGFIFERKKKMKWKLQRGSVRPSFGAKSSLRSQFERGPWIEREEPVCLLGIHLREEKEDEVEAVEGQREAELRREELVAIAHPRRQIASRAP